QEPARLPLRVSTPDGMQNRPDSPIRASAPDGRENRPDTHPLQDSYQHRTTARVGFASYRFRTSTKVGPAPLRFRTRTSARRTQEPAGPSRPPRNPYRLRSPCTEMSAVLRTISRNRGHPRRTVEDHGCATPERTTGTRPRPRHPPAPEPPGSPGTTAPAGSPFARACRPDDGGGPEHAGGG